LHEEQRVNHEVIRCLEAEQDRQLEERQAMERQVRDAELELKVVISEAQEAKREAARAQEAMLKVVRDHEMEVQRVTQ
jgi:GTP cyclohydrolase III